MKSVRRVLNRLALATAASFILLALFSPLAAAQADGSGFSLQVSPSPIITSSKPGASRTVELGIKNTGRQADQLRMGLRAFKVNENGEVQLTTETPKEVEGWVSFANPEFSVEAGAVFTQKIVFNTPADAGFSYSFAILISRANAPPPTGGKSSLQGSVAVFTLFSVDRPDAVRKFEVTSFTSVKRVYEYLPATLSIKIKNTGNTILQPYGNVYIQRNGNNANPISVLPVNAAGSYVLPDSSRVYPVEWRDGFPVYTSVKDVANSDAKQNLVWHWADADKLRFGKYVAKLVAVYNDGQRDVPIQAEVSFWVIPWKLFGGLLLVLVILIVGLFTIFRKAGKVVHIKNRVPKHAHKT